MKNVTSIRALASQTAVYGLSSIVGRVLNYLLVPLYTAVFVPGEYGIVTELYAYMAFLNVIFSYGMETAYFRFASRSEDKKQVFSVVQSALLLSTLVLGGLLYFNSEAIANYLEYPDQGNIIRWCSLIVSIDAIVAIPFAQLRLEGRAIQFATFRLINIMLNIGLNLTFLVLIPYLLKNELITANQLGWMYNAQFGIEYVFISNLLANAFYLIVLIKRLLSVRLTFSPNRIRPILNYALPLLILGLAGVTNEMLSRAFLRHWLPEGFYSHLTNNEALGIFGACYKLSVFMTLAVQAYRYAFEPYFFKKSEEKDSPEAFAKIMSAFVIFGVVSWVGISLILPEIAPIFLRQEAYLEALPVVPLLLGGGLFLGIYYNLSPWYKLTDRTWLGAVISLSGASITVLFNYLLIPVLGYMGSAWATLISYFSMTLISYFWGRNYLKVPYRLPSLIIYILLAAITISVLLQLDSIFQRYLAGVVGLIVLAGFIYLFERDHLLSGLIKRT